MFDSPAPYGLCERDGCLRPLHNSRIRFCSAECVAIGRRKDRGNCQVCGNPLKAGTSQLVACSRECAARVNCTKAHPDPLRETIRRLWDEGVSTPQIGLQVGLSKNAICGMVRRMNLPKRRETSGGFKLATKPLPRSTCSQCDQPAYCRGLCSRHYWQQHKPAPRENSRPLFDRIQRPSHEPEVRMLFDTLTPRQSASLGRKPPRPPELKLPKPEPFSVFKTCQFIEAEDRKAYLFCDQPTQPGSAYCPTHHRRCYVPRQALDDGMKTAA